MSKSSTVFPRRRRIMESGALAPGVQKFTDSLIALGYTRQTTGLYSDSARHFAHWLSQTPIALSEVDEGLVEQFQSHTCRCPGSRHASLSAKYGNRVRRFVRFLAECGMVRATKPHTPEIVEKQQVREFQQWLRQHRGVSETTLKRCGRLLMKLLPALGDDPAVYDASLIRRVILEESRKGTRFYAKSIASTLRSYLRFLAARGECRSWLDQAVPAISQ
jgi:integrase/recombinase XerD